mgnify:FL=1
MALSKEELSAIIDGIAKADDKDKEKLAKALKLKTSAEVEIETGSSLKNAGLLAEAFGDVANAGEKAKQVLNDMKKAKVDMANIDLEVAKATRDYIAEVEAGAKVYEKMKDINKDSAKTDEEKDAALKKLATQYGISADEAAAYYIELNTKLTPAFRAGEKAGASFATKLGGAMGILSPKANAMFKGFMKFASIAKRPDGLMGVAKGISKVINPTTVALGVIGLIVTETMKLALAVDKATSAFAKQTGAGRTMTKEIMFVAGSYRNLGLGAEEAGKAAGELFNSFTGFTQLTKSGRQDLMLTVASMERIGVSGATAANSLQIMANNFGMSTRQASKMTKSLAIAGSKIGISAAKMMDGFVAASKSLAVYGKESIKVFTDLAAQAKAAGVETQTLLGIAKQFDTFSGAADTVGKLNSILGTQMSAVDLLTMKENERIETLIRSVQAQGMVFSDMDKYSQMAVANAAGITDMSEAQRIFGMSVNDYRKGLKDSEAEKEFNERLKDAMAIGEKITKIFQNFAIQLAPMVEFLADLAQRFLDWSQSMNGTPVMILGIAAAIVVAMTVLPALLGIFGAMTAGAAALAPAIAPAAIAIGGLMAIIAAGLLLMDTEALMGFGAVFSGLFGGGETEIGVTTRITTLGDAVDFTDQLVSNEATLMPLLGDLALISTGATTQSITRAATSTAINQFAANFENVFKPEVKVMVGTTELDARIDNRIAKTAMGT